jgi:spoIIIJ-associated protein
MKKKVEVLNKLVSELLSLMGSNATAEVSYDKTGEVFMVDVNAGDETGLLIGKKGETLSSLQTILGIILKQRIGDWERVVVNVGDYRQKEEDYLKNLAFAAAQRAKETGEPQNLYNLKAWQRRVVHMALSEDSEITTESVGEGEERFLVVKPKK